MHTTCTLTLSLTLTCMHTHTCTIHEQIHTGDNRCCTFSERMCLASSGRLVLSNSANNNASLLNNLIEVHNAHLYTHGNNKRIKYMFMYTYKHTCTCTHTRARTHTHTHRVQTFPIHNTLLGVEASHSLEHSNATWHPTQYPYLPKQYIQQ